MDYDAVDLCAGPGGWDEGARALGLTTLGVETDTAACTTAVSAGHARLQSDISTLDPCAFYGIPGLIASPPCKDFSTAGRGNGLEGDTGCLVLEPLRWAKAMQPMWMAWEQVTPVLPIWRAAEQDLRRLGYGTWSGVLNAADYGVPQERKRAILLGLHGGHPTPPPPTHAAHPDGLFDTLQPWVTLAEHLGIGRGWVYDSGQNSEVGGRRSVRYVRSCDRPAGTITTKAARQWVLRRGQERRKVTLAEAATLQTFRPDYPWSGSATERAEQVGNAVPPLLAAHVLSALTGLEMRAAA